MVFGKVYCIVLFNDLFTSHITSHLLLSTLTPGISSRITTVIPVDSFYSLYSICLYGMICYIVLLLSVLYSLSTSTYTLHTHTTNTQLLHTSNKL